MIRRIGAALIGLALTLPLAVMPAAAHTSAGLVVDYDVSTVGDATRVAGTVTNHTSSRRSTITVTATWYDVADPETREVVASESAAATPNNVAPHSVAPFDITETASIAGATHVEVTATASITSTIPAGGLHVDPGTLTGDVYTGSVTNDSATNATGLVVYATRSDATGFEEAAGSAPIALAAGATANYVITFEAAGDGTDVSNLVAKTNTGAFLTSWNNFFGDLGTTTFKTEIEFLADEGITLGTGNGNFSPKASVTRVQMAIFLNRALELDDVPLTTQFTDIATQSAEAKQAISNLVANEITNGCATDKFCPTSNVTRGQMSKFMGEGYDLPAATGENIDRFTDDDGHFSEPYNDSMAEAEITFGCTATTFCTSSNVTREQMAAFLFRAETP